MSEIYLNKCIACGKVEVGPRSSVIEDGPPFSLCMQHSLLLQDKDSYGVYCLKCDRMTFVLNIADYKGEKLVFAKECPCCNPAVENIRADSWSYMMKQKSSTPSDEGKSRDDESSSMGETATPS